MTALTDIEHRVQADQDNFAEGYSDQSIRDRTHLLTLVRQQQDQLDRVLELAHWAGKRGWTVPVAALRSAVEEAGE